MKVIAPYYEILFLPDREQVLALVEAAGRTCYKSEHLISSDSAPEFVKRIVASGHHSVIEHANLSVRFVCDRGVTHELVRHRLAAYSQESTRYANYAQDRFGSQITIIKPMFWAEDSAAYHLWEKAMAQTEEAYLELLSGGAKPQEARAVLPNSLKTEIVMTANLREWRHVLGLRSSKAAHPQIRQIMLPLMGELGERLPEFFADLAEKYAADIAAFASGPAALGGPEQT
ncbi:MAG: FAD-dependent thymidylate synthase [Deltaproteobacteria bacterium]|nr:FAD-dependent thymidylate synthase [Deltaproteobacteria bacterium]